MDDYDLDKMESEIPLAMMVRYRVREPTLNQVQLNAESLEVEHFLSVPAWLKNSELHPGLPEHFLAANAMVGDDLPDLPFDVNREIQHKLIIVPIASSKKSQKLPALIDLMNGTVVVTGPPFADETVHNIEIFLHLHDKLLPCCYTQRPNIIATSPFTRSRARVYYIPDSSPPTPPEISFVSAASKVLQRCQFSVKWLSRSVPYHNLHY